MTDRQPWYATLQAISQRQELYKNFIEEASRLYADALTHDEAEISNLVGVYALIGRMKIVSSDEVNEAAEKAARSIKRARVQRILTIDIRLRSSNSSIRTHPIAEDAAGGE